MKKHIKNIRKTLCCIFLIVMMLTTIPISASAAVNPYPSSQTIDGITTIPCTYYAWQQAYNNTGVSMPDFGHAKNWYTGAQNAGYAVGTVAKPKSIAVWSGGTYGHVSYVVSVNGSTMTVNEGGMHNSSNTGPLNGNGIYNGNVVNSIVGKQKGNGSSKILVGFIYLTEAVSTNVTFTNRASENEPSSNNAIVHYYINKPTGWAVSEIGIAVREEGSTYSKGWEHKQAPTSGNYSSWSKVPVSWDFKNEVGFTPTHATKYYYQFYAKVNGKEYWSDEFNITTTGSHSYPSSWTTTKAATCTTDGSAKRSCSCGKTETKVLTKLGHNFESAWTVDTPASCTTAGSKSHHCARCSEKSSVTAIPANGHSFGNWKTVTEPTCTSAGKKTRTCSVCKTPESATVTAKGHSYSSQWTVDTPASCIKAGTKSKHCSACDSKTIVTTIPPTGHNWSSFEITIEATTEKQGVSTRKCVNSGCDATETKTIPKLSNDGHTHTYGDWQQTKAPSCTEDGQQSRTCTICNEAESYTVSQLGHIFGDWSEPDNSGVSRRICSNCSVAEEQLVITKEPESSSNSSSSEIVETLEDTISDVENAPKKTSSNNTLLIVIILVLGVTLIGALIYIIIKKKNK